MSNLLTAEQVAKKLDIPKWAVERNYKPISGTNKYNWYQIKKQRIRLIKTKQNRK